MRDPGATLSLRALTLLDFDELGACRRQLSKDIADNDLRTRLTDSRPGGTTAYFSVCLTQLRTSFLASSFP